MLSYVDYATKHFAKVGMFLQHCFVFENNKHQKAIFNPIFLKVCSHFWHFRLRNPNHQPKIGLYAYFRQHPFIFENNKYILSWHELPSWQFEETQIIGNRPSLTQFFSKWAVFFDTFDSRTWITNPKLGYTPSSVNIAS